MTIDANKSILATTGLFGITVCAGLVLGSSYVSAEDIVDDVSIEVPTSCSMSGSGMNTHTAEVANGIYQANIGTTTINALCNDNAGFSIYAAGYTGETIGQTNSNKLVGTNASGNATIDTGTATSAGNPDVSSWAMKLATDSEATYPLTLTTGYNAYHAVPNEYTKVATRLTGTDTGASATGSTFTTTYAAYISRIQPADIYTGKVKYVLLHPNTAPAPEPCPNDEPCIRVTTPPTKVVYENRETIDPAGIIVKLYDGNGIERSVLPNNELTFDTTTVDNGVRCIELSDEWMPAFYSPPGGRGWGPGYTRWFKSGTGSSCVVFIRFPTQPDGSITDPDYYYDHGIYFYAFSKNPNATTLWASVSGRSINNLPTNSFETFYTGAYYYTTINGVKYYGENINGAAAPYSNPSSPYVPVIDVDTADDNTVERAFQYAYGFFNGEYDNSQTITVSWYDSLTGKTLTDSFSIIIEE